MHTLLPSESYFCPAYTINLCILKQSFSTLYVIILSYQRSILHFTQTHFIRQMSQVTYNYVYTHFRKGIFNVYALSHLYLATYIDIVILLYN